MVAIPSTPLCKKQYAVTLSGSAEVDGDHYATLYLPPVIEGSVLNELTGTWTPISGSESFLFTELGETYQIKLWVKYATLGPDQLVLPYTVTAIYAPSWASISDRIYAVPYTEPCCGLAIAHPIGTSTATLSATSLTFIFSGIGADNSTSSPGTHTVNWASYSYPDVVTHPTPAISALAQCKAFSGSRTVNVTGTVFGKTLSISVTYIITKPAASSTFTITIVKVRASGSGDILFGQTGVGTGSGDTSYLAYEDHSAKTRFRMATNMSTLQDIGGGATYFSGSVTTELLLEYIPD
jgi:hypothetical protein